MATDYWAQYQEQYQAHYQKQQEEYQKQRAERQERLKALSTEEVVTELLQHTTGDCFRCFQRGMCDDATDMIRELGRRFARGAANV